MAITERLSQAVEKAWRIEQLEEANYAYTQMLGFVSHELQSPVASMVTDAQILTQGYLGDLTPEQRAKVQSMERKGQYLLSLVREYLDLARVEGGELRLSTRSRVDVMEQVVAEAVDLVRPQADAHGIHLMTCVPSPALPPVCCDPTLLRIVTVNLLDNAIKYGNEGGDIRVKAEVGLDEKGGERLRISVWNSGPGFSHGAAEQALPPVLAPGRPGPQEPPRHRRRPVQLLAHRPAPQGAHHGRLQARRVGRVQFRDTGYGGLRRASSCGPRE